MRFTTTFSVIFTAVSAFALTGCFVKKKSISADNVFSVWKNDTAECNRIVLPKEPMVFAPRTKFVLNPPKTTPTYNLLAVDTINLTFQYGDTIYKMNLNTEIVESVMQSDFIRWYLLSFSSPDLVICSRHYRETMFSLVDIKNKTERICAQCDKEFHQIGKILQNRNGFFYYTREFKTYKFDSEFNCIDSFAAPYIHFYRADIKDNRIIAPDEYELSANGSYDRTVIITDTAGKKIVEFEIPRVNVKDSLDYVINSIRFNPINTDEIFCCIQNLGIISYSIKKNKTKLIANSCQRRFFSEIVIAPDGKKIYAQTSSGEIYTISLAKNLPPQRLSIFH